MVEKLIEIEYAKPINDLLRGRFGTDAPQIRYVDMDYTWGFTGLLDNKQVERLMFSGDIKNVVDFITIGEVEYPLVEKEVADVLRDALSNIENNEKLEFSLVSLQDDPQGRSAFQIFEEGTPQL